MTTKQSDNEQLLSWMGVGNFDNIADVQKSFQEDMARFAPNLDESRQSYRNVFEYLAKENEAIASREVTAKDGLKKLKEQLLATEADNEKKVAQYMAAANTATQDAAAERTHHNQDREALEKTKQDLQQNLDKQKADFDSQLADINKQLSNLNDKLAKSEHAKENLLAEVSKSAESFEIPDGLVSWINQDGTVWINLGSADSLRPQITFSVFDADAQDPAKTEKKGSIEVTRILGDHIAEARVTDDDLKNPILTGDQIYSQVWHRGKMLRFALTGILDLNGDGLNDMQLARDLVKLNGGAVDAYLGDDGKVHGEITVHTRYLVVGDQPTGANQANMQEGFQQMGSDAKLNGVEQITLDKFINKIGYSPDDRVVTLGPGARSSDFPAKPESGTNSGPSRTTPFRSRSPNQNAPTGRYLRFSP